MSRIPSVRDIAGEVTATILARLEAGILPWARSWSLTGEGGRPLRHEGTPYSGINTLWLWATADMRGYRSRYWMTARQAGELGGCIRPGACPSMSLYASVFRKPGQPMLTGESAARFIRFLRSYAVYNADEIDGLPAWYYPRDVPPTPALLSQRQDAIDAFFTAIPARVRHGGDEAYYCPGTDRIQLPHPGSFASGDAYASTRGHETAHWSGAPARLARTFGKRFGDRAYAMEELTAELTASMICADLGLPTSLHDSHASYVSHWMTVMRADTSAIFTAAARAEQAFAYLRGFSTPAAGEQKAPAAGEPEIPAAIAA